VVLVGTYEAKAETLKIDQRDTIAPRIVSFGCPSRRYTDEIVDLAFCVLLVSSYDQEQVGNSLPGSSPGVDRPRFEARR